MTRRFYMSICLVIALPTLAACDWLKSEPSPARFQIVYSPHAARDTFLLDTATGRVWQLTAYSYLEGQPVAWAMMTRIDNLEDFGRFIQEHSKTPKDPLAPPPKSD